MQASRLPGATLAAWPLTLAVLVLPVEVVGGVVVVAAFVLVVAACVGGAFACVDPVGVARAVDMRWADEDEPLPPHALSADASATADTTIAVVLIRGGLLSAPFAQLSGQKPPLGRRSPKSAAWTAFSTWSLLTRWPTYGPIDCW